MVGKGGASLFLEDEGKVKNDEGHISILKQRDVFWKI